MYCPKCRKLMKVANYKGIDRYICQSSSCRTAISENKIIQLDIDSYTKIKEYIIDEEEDNTLKTFVLSMFNYIVINEDSIAEIEIIFQ